MDSQTPSTESFTQIQAYIFEEIRQLGYENQNQQLYQMGFTQPSQNLKYLRKYHGDVQTVVSKLLEKRAQRNTYQDTPCQSDTEEVQQDDTENYPNFQTPQSQMREAQPERRKLRARAREFTPRSELRDYHEWPMEITRIYLDGSNMLYVEAPIRKLAITQRKREAEKLLTDLILQFTTHMGMFDLVLIFDKTTLIFNEQVATTRRIVNFSVLSATPNFSNTDDALVCWSESLADQLKNCLFVTSDRELQTRLIEKGVHHIMKTKRWFYFVKAFLGEPTYNSILSQSC